MRGRVVHQRVHARRGQDAPQRSYRWQGGERPSRREAQAVPAGPPPARGARAFCGGGSGAPRGRGVAVPEAARAGGGAAPFGCAGTRVARYFHHHPAGSRGLVARG